MILLSTTGVMPGYAVDEVHGLVTGHVVAGANAFKDLKGKFSDFFGGRSGTYEKVLEKYEITAVEIMTGKAAAVDANAIVGISFDYEVMSFDGQMLMILCSGTAMKLRKLDAGSAQRAAPVSDAVVPPSPTASPPGPGAAHGHNLELVSSDEGPAQSDRYRRDVDAELRARLDE